MSNYKKFIALLLPQERKQLPILLSLIMMGMLLETLGVGLVIPALALMTQENLIQNHPTLYPIMNFFGNPSQTQLVMGGMLSLLGLYFFKTGFLVFMLSKQHKFISGLQSSLSNRLFSGYLHQPWTFHLQRNSAHLIGNAMTEVNLFTNSALQSGMLLLTESVVLFGIIALIIVVEPFGAPFVIVILGITAWGFHRSLRNYLLRLGKERQHHDYMRFQQLQQGLGGAKDVKILGREGYFIEQYSVHSDTSASATKKLKTLLELPRLWLELLAVGGLCMLVSVLLAQGKPPSALLPILGLFAAASFRIAPSANRILTALQNLRSSLPVVNKLYEEMQLFDKAVCTHQQAMPTFKYGLELKHVSYHYDNASHQALNNISLTILRGTSVGFIGTSGAGKSTLVDVILGLLTPVKGEVAVDGVNIQCNLRGWQNQIGYVPQTIFLTDDSLRRNIAFGLSDDLINDEAIARVVKAAQLEEFIAGLSDGIETLVGERGVRLSGGQRQRIGIARALYHDPAVLVLDEATSALDNETEIEVMNAINALHGDKTLLIIAHRLTTIANCDLVYKIEMGRVVEVIDSGNLHVSGDVEMCLE